MKFTVIGHACLFIETSGERILVDPWLAGSCYWRSWWHFPPNTDLRPEFLSPEGEVAYGPRLSPDGRRVLYLAAAGGGQPRLSVLDLATRGRVVVDEPGHTSGHCWSPDGKRVAYTWQRPPGRGKGAERETFLITCDPAGRDRKTVTKAECATSRATAATRFSSAGSSTQPG